MQYLVDGEMNSLLEPLRHLLPVFLAPNVETHFCWNSLSSVCTVGTVVCDVTKKLLLKKKDSLFLAGSKASGICRPNSFEFLV